MKLDEIKQLLESNDFKVPSETNREGTSNSPTAKTPSPKQAGGELSPETLKSQSPSSIAKVQKRRGDKDGELPVHGEAPKEERVGLKNPATVSGQEWEKSEVPVKYKIDKLAEQRKELVSAVLEYAELNDIDLDSMNEDEIAELVEKLSLEQVQGVVNKNRKAQGKPTEPLKAPETTTPKTNESLEIQITDAILEYAQQYGVDLETISESELEKLYDAAVMALTEGDKYSNSGVYHDVTKNTSKPKSNIGDNFKKDDSPASGHVPPAKKDVKVSDKSKKPDCDPITNHCESINVNFTLTNQLGSLLESEGLTEEFKTQAITVFESAVNLAAKEHIEDLREQFDERLQESVDQIKQELNENTEKYLDYVVSEWMNENKLAIESATRNNVAESFMSKLKDLLEEHYVDLPNEKADIYEQEVLKNKKLSEELNTVVKERFSLVEQVESLVKQVKVERFVRNMTEVEAEKVRELSESIDLDDSFDRKIKTLHENFFPTKKPSSSMLTEEITEQKQQTSVPVDMDAYIKFMSKMNS